jgi:hypothetical protein
VPIILALFPGEHSCILPPARSKGFGREVLLQRIRLQQSAAGAQRLDAHFPVAHDARLDDRMVCSQRRIVCRRTFVGTATTKEGKVPFIQSSRFQSPRLSRIA